MSFHHVGIVDGQYRLALVDYDHQLRTFDQALVRTIGIADGWSLSATDGITDISGHRRRFGLGPFGRSPGRARQSHNAATMNHKRSTPAISNIFFIANLKSTCLGAKLIVLATRKPKHCP